MIGGAIAKGLNVPFVSSIVGRYGGFASALVGRDYLREYKNWVFACVQARAEEVGNINLKLMKGGEEVDDNEVLSLLQKVSPTMTKFELFYATQAFKDLDGNAFWYLARDQKGKGQILEIYIMRPDKVQLVMSKENPLQVAGYIYNQPDGQKIPFESQEILHFKNFNPMGNHPFPHRGVGIVEAAAWTIDTDNEARKWNFNFFKNSARPDGVLTTAGEAAMGAEDYQRLQEEWNTKHQGSDNAHKVAILSGGMTWTEISRSQKDMDFGGQRTMNRDEILAMFRVPKSIIGISDDVNRANAEATIYVFALRTVKPLMQQMVDALNEFLLPEFGDDLELTFESPVAADRKQDLEEYAAGLTQGWLSINEVRENEGLEPVEGGDDLYLPLNYVPVANTQGQLEVPADPAVPPVKQAKKKVATVVKKPKEKKRIVAEKKDKKSTAAEAVEKLLASRKSQTRLPAAKKEGTVRELTAEAKDKYIEMYKANLHVSRAPLEKEITKFFNKQEKEVIKNARAQMKFYTPKDIVEKGLLEFLFGEEEAVQASISLITPFIREYIKTGGNHAANLVGLSAFDAATESLNAFVEKRSKYFAETINGTTREALLTSIKEGLDKGETLSDIEDRIAGVYDIAKGSRTQMIARTEISAGVNQGSKGAYQQAGIEKWQWVVVSPEDTDCLENDGVIRVIGDAFPDGDEEPPVHPNCECTTVPVFNTALDSGDEE